MPGGLDSVAVVLSVSFADRSARSVRSSSGPRRSSPGRRRTMPRWSPTAAVVARGHRFGRLRGCRRRRRPRGRRGDRRLAGRPASSSRCPPAPSPSSSSSATRRSHTTTDDGQGGDGDADPAHHVAAVRDPPPVFAGELASAVGQRRLRRRALGRLVARRREHVRRLVARRRERRRSRRRPSSAGLASRRRRRPAAHPSAGSGALDVVRLRRAHPSRRPATVRRSGVSADRRLAGIAAGPLWLLRRLVRRRRQWRIGGTHGSTTITSLRLSSVAERRRRRARRAISVGERVPT